jgi:hypothetical protein
LEFRLQPAFDLSGRAGNAGCRLRAAQYDYFVKMTGAAGSDDSQKRRNYLSRWTLMGLLGIGGDATGKAGLDGTPTVPRLFVPKSLKSAWPADRKNTLDG